VLVLGIIVGIAGSIFVKRILSGKSTKTKVSELQINSFIENMKSVGELVVFKVFTKEIVTAADHWLGQVGKKYLTWLISKMKMAMIFQFEINFWYDLKSSDFRVTDAGDGSCVITMPQCLYNISTDFHSDNYSTIRRPFPARIVFLFLSMIAGYSCASKALQKVSVNVFSF